MSEQATLDLAGLRALRAEAGAAFEQWEDEVPTPVVQASRNAYRTAIDALLALGEHPPVDAVLAVIRQFVETFNELDQAEKHWIGTIEREDICDALDPIIECTGLQDREELEEGTDWRDW